MSRLFESEEVRSRHELDPSSAVASHPGLVLLDSSIHSSVSHGIILDDNCSSVTSTSSENPNYMLSNKERGKCDSTPTSKDAGVQVSLPQTSPNLPQFPLLPSSNSKSPLTVSSSPIRSIQDWGSIHEPYSPRENVPWRVDAVMVLQGDPFYFINDKGKVKPLVRLDHEEELKMLTEAITQSGKLIEIVPRKLTFKALNDVFSTPKGNVVHIATHGQEGYVNVEDHEEIGLGRKLLAGDLHKLFERGGKHVRLCFVSACRTETIGTALLNTGVSHVICCRKDKSARDDVAIFFAHSFYSHLFGGKMSIRESFDNAILLTKARHSKAEADKFCLLPKMSSNHDVKVMAPVAEKGFVPLSRVYLREPSSGFPPEPEIVAGRDNEQRQLINALVRCRFVGLTGKAGVGKTEIALSACHYLFARIYFKLLRWDKIWWLEYGRPCTGQITMIFDAVKNMSVSVTEFRKRLRFEEHYVEFTESFQRKNGLLVIDAKYMKEPDEAEKMSIFLEEFLGRTHMKVLTIHYYGVNVNPSRGTWAREYIEVKPMDVDNSLRLVQSCLDSTVIQKNRHGVSSVEELCRVLYDPRMEKILQRSWGVDHIQNIATKIFSMLGNGLPKEIRKKTQEMTADCLDDLLRLRKEFDSSTPFPIEIYKHLCEKRCELGQADSAADWPEAKKTKEMIVDLENRFRGSMNMTEMMKLYNELELAKARARDNEDYDQVGGLNDSLKDLQQKIDRETEAERQLLAERHLPYLEIHTRHHLDIQVEKTIKCYKEACWVSKDFNCARELKQDKLVLESLRKRLPTLETLISEISDLEKEKAEAVSNYSTCVAEVLSGHLLKKRKQLSLEEEARGNSNERHKMRHSRSLCLPNYLSYNTTVKIGVSPSLW